MNGSLSTWIRLAFMKREDLIFIFSDSREVGGRCLIPWMIESRLKISDSQNIGVKTSSQIYK
jgi:hypothetical protein